MAQINIRERIIHCKIVYYGAAMSGKSTCLAYIHSQIDMEDKSSMIYNHDLFLLYFYWVRPEKYRGFNIYFHVRANPGIMIGPHKRTMVLDRADGVVFVVDSKKNKFHENEQALREIASAISSSGKDLSTFPIVVQYNKRDISDNLPIDILGNHFNRHRWPVFETIATTGDNVMSAFETICNSVIVAL